MNLDFLSHQEQMQRHELDALLLEDLAFYNQMKSQMTDLFLDFVEEYCRVFTQSPEYQYVLVPLPCHDEFQTYMKNPEEPIYNDRFHNHYIDPPMGTGFYRFCEIHPILPMCQSILSHPPTQRLPVSIIMEEVERHIIPGRYYPLLVECVEPSGLSFLLPMTNSQHSVSIAKLMLRYSQRFPLFIGNTFITNWLIQQGCGLDIIDRMWNNGFPVKFPLRVVENTTQKLFAIPGPIVEWCFQKCKHNYPFDTSVDHIIMNYYYQDDVHFPMIRYSLQHGHVPSNTAFSILLKKTNLATKDLVFQDYVVQQLKTGHWDVGIWADTAWQTTQDDVIQLMMTFCKQDVFCHAVLHLCMNSMDIIHVDMDYWVLKLREHYFHYMKFVHLVRFYKDGQVRMVDRRILDHVRGTLPPFPTIPSSYPPFYERHPQTIVFVDNHDKKVEIPVYLSFLRSQLLHKISTATGFKPPSNPDKNVVQLDLGLPNVFQDQKKVMQDWVVFSYFRHIPQHCSVEDVIDLYSLSQYLVDEECEKQSEQWLDCKYMNDIDTHKEHRHNNDCLLCAFWQRSN